MEVKMKSLKMICFMIIAAAVLGMVMAVSADDVVHTIVLSNGTALLDGKAVPEYDYAWHADPGVVHDEVKNAPA